MSEKRFVLSYEKGNEAIFEDRKDVYPKRMTNKEVENKLNEQQSTINKQEEEIKKLKKTERSWRKIHCCNKESNNCGILQRQQNNINKLYEENEELKLKIVSLENEIQRQNNELKNTRKEFIKKTDELNWLKSEDYLKKIY